MKTVFTNTGNSKTNKQHQFFHNFSQLLNLRSLDKHVPLQNVSLYYT